MSKIPYLSKDLKILYTNRFLLRVGLGFITIFGVIFLFEQLKGSITTLLIALAAAYLLFVIFIPLSARLIKSVGMKKMMLISVPFLVVSIAMLYIWDIKDVEAYVFLTLYLFFSSMYRIVYWVPFHIDFAKFSDTKTRGSQIAILKNITETTLAILPFIAGVLIQKHGFDLVFIITIAIILLASIPLFLLKETYEKYDYGYKETFKELLKKYNRPLLISQFSNGIQSIVALTIWPIFVFILLKGNYISIGFITSLTIVAIVVLQYIIGLIADRSGNTKKLQKFGSLFSTIGWIAKVFVSTGAGIFIVDTFHNLGRAANQLPFEITAYSQASDNGHYVDEYTVLKEIALNGGRFFMLVLSAILVFFVGIEITFVVAALATLAMNILQKQHQIQEKKQAI